MLFLSNLAIVGAVLGLAAAAPGPVAKRDGSCKPDYNIIPWDPKYNTGILPPCIEGALGSQLGPTFLNPFYQNVTDLAGGLGGCFGSCTLIVVRELPCILKAVQSGDVTALTRCGVTKSDICACATCLPDFAYKYVQPWCASVGDAEPPTSELCDSVYIDTADTDTLACLGLLKVTEYQALKATADAAPPTSPNPDNLLGCVLGASCGSCCCIGLCFFGSCTGICA